MPPERLCRPSRADEYLKQTLKQATALVDVRVLDHLIVAGGTVLSMAERGYFDAGAFGLLPLCVDAPYGRGTSASAVPSALGSRLTDQWPPCSN